MKKDYDIEGVDSELDMYATTYYLQSDGKNGTVHSLVLILYNTKNKYKHKIGPNILGHESFHAANFIFDHIGEEERCEEPRAYLIDNIINISHNFLKNNK